MKQNADMMELDYYRVYLQGHLHAHYFPQRDRQRFIETRAEEAYDMFVTRRLEGRPVHMAHEMAMRTLLEGLYVSRYDVVYDILEESFWTRLPQEYWPDFAVHLIGLPSIREILDRYGINGDFPDRERYGLMLTELLGTITEILDGYEL